MTDSLFAFLFSSMIRGGDEGSEERQAADVGASNAAARGPSGPDDSTQDDQAEVTPQTGYFWSPSLGLPIPLDCCPAIWIEEEERRVKEMLKPSIFRTLRDEATGE